MKKVLFLLLASFLVLVACGNDSESEEKKKVSSEKKKPKSDRTELDSKIDDLIWDEQKQAIDLNQNLYDDHKVSKDELKEENKRIFNVSEQIKKDVKQDKEYKHLKKLEKQDDLTDREILDFMHPYLNKISGLESYSEQS